MFPLSFELTADPNARDVRRNDSNKTLIGNIHVWDRMAQRGTREMIWQQRSETTIDLTIWEMEQIINMMNVLKEQLK